MSGEINAILGASTSKSSVQRVSRPATKSNGATKRSGKKRGRRRRKSEPSTNTRRTDKIYEPGFHTYANETAFPFPFSLRGCVSDENTVDSSDIDTSSTDSDRCCQHAVTKTRKRKLPPVGVFWDIENCQVPKGRSAIAVVQLIRTLFLTRFREAEFLVVCDVKKENVQIVQELNDAQVNLVHVSSTCKNAADEKLRQAIRRFADTYKSPAAVVLISGDINFAADLSDLRYRKKIHVILLHQNRTSEALVLCSNEHYDYPALVDTLPARDFKSNTIEPMEVIVQNLPTSVDAVKLRNRLKRLSDNCGGRVVFISSNNSMAILRFSTLDLAVRAQKRMDAEDVFGNKIKVSNPLIARGNWFKPQSPFKSCSGRRYYQDRSAYLDAPVPANIPAPALTYYPIGTSQPVPLPAPYCGDSSRLMNRWSNKDVWPQCPSSLPPSGLRPEMFDMQLKTPPGMRRIRSRNDAADQPNVYFDQQRRMNCGEAAASVSANNYVLYGISSDHITSVSTLSDAEEPELNFPPIPRSNSWSNSTSDTSVDLLVSNLDQTIDPKELKVLLSNMFKEHAMVLGLTLRNQVDGSLIAVVKVSNAQDAQYVISQLHRRKIGNKRVVISNTYSPSPDPAVLRSQVIALLQEVPGNKMPLFKFRELLESKYRTSVSVSELCRLRDVFTISDESGGRTVALCSEYRTAPSPHFMSANQLAIPYCVIHCPDGLNTKGWAEQETPLLPKVRYTLKQITFKVHRLLQSHSDSLPLPSFVKCFEAVLNETLNKDDSGVPLEHLITCIPGVELSTRTSLIKHLVWSKSIDDSRTDVSDSNTSGTSENKSPLPPLATQLALFSRELVDLTKNANHCLLPLSKFIPTYHHHFGRQCRVADYGFTKLIDLLDSLSHVVQVIGEGDKRLITLSHQTQMRRFTSDLLRMLKNQASKQIEISEFATVYKKVMSKDFDPVDYGMCELSDLLEEVSENTVLITVCNDEMVIALPKRKQTSDEIARTKRFASEVVELLRHAPQCSMLFNKFIPAYHHHFGHQCRVADYGFTKLIELFEAIPDVVKIQDMVDGERRVSLTPGYALQVVSNQIVALVKQSLLMSLPLSSLASTFLKAYGFPLRPEVYECFSLEELLQKLTDTLQVSVGIGGLSLIHLKTPVHPQFALRVWGVLLHPPHRMAFSQFLQMYQDRYDHRCYLEHLEQLHNVVQITGRNKHETEITLTPQYVVASRIYNLLYEEGGSVLFSNLRHVYANKYGETLDGYDFISGNVEEFLRHFPSLFNIKGKKGKRHLVLNEFFIDGKVASYDTNPGEGVKNPASGYQWLPSSADAACSKSEPKVLVPKPDTPPSQDSSNGFNMWYTPPKFGTSEPNLCIPMPFLRTPKPLCSPRTLATLISPAKILLPAYNNPGDGGVPFPAPPDPSQLPLPASKLLATGKNYNQDDSGINLPNFDTDLDHKEPDSPNEMKRKVRVAAQFAKPMQFM